MKLLLIVVALVAFTHAAPTTHTLEVGSNGMVGSVSSSLVSIDVNILKDQEIPALVRGAVIYDTDVESVAVVDTPIVDVNPVDVISVNPVIVVPNPIDVISVSSPIVEPNPIDVISVSPEFVEEPEPIDVGYDTPDLASVGSDHNGPVFINVILNMIFDSPSAVASVNVPQQTVNQSIGRGL